MLVEDVGGSKNEGPVLGVLTKRIVVYIYILILGSISGPPTLIVAWTQRSKQLHSRKEAYRYHQRQWDLAEGAVHSRVRRGWSQDMHHFLGP